MTEEALEEDLIRVRSGSWAVCARAGPGAWQGEGRSNRPHRAAPAALIAFLALGFDLLQGILNAGPVDSDDGLDSLPVLVDEEDGLYALLPGGPVTSDRAHNGHPRWFGFCVLGVMAQHLELGLSGEDFHIVDGHLVELHVIHEPEIHLLRGRLVALTLTPLIAIDLHDCEQHAKRAPG